MKLKKSLKITLAVIAAVMLGVVAPMTARSLAEAGIEQPASSRLLVGGARAAVFVLAPLALGLAAAWAVLYWASDWACAAFTVASAW